MDTKKKFHSKHKSFFYIFFEGFPVIDLTDLIGMNDFPKVNHSVFVTDLEEAEYHLRPEISHSKLEQYRENSREYQRLYVDKTKLQDFDTKSLAIGRALHRAVLEPDRFSSMYAVADEDWDERTKAGVIIRDAFRAKHPGKIVLRKKEWNHLDDCIEAAYANPEIKRLIECPGFHEVSVFWMIDLPGFLPIPARCRIDKVILMDGDEILAPTAENCFRANHAIQLDLKFMNNGNPRSFAWDCVTYGYHRQASMYRDAIQSCLPNAKVSIVYAVVSKSCPRGYYYDFDQGFIAEGWAETLQDLEGLCSSLATESWDLPDGGKHTIHDPRYRQ